MRQLTLHRAPKRSLEKLLTFKTFSLWIHIAAVVVWVGGLFAISFVFVPALRRGIGSQVQAARLILTVVRRFQRVSREIIFLIVLTGIFNLIHAGVARGFDFSAEYIRMLALKVTLFVLIAAVQAWQTFHLAPAYAAITSEPDPTPGAVRRLERWALMTSILNAVLAASVILLGLGLRYR